MLLPAPDLPVDPAMRQGEQPCDRQDPGHDDRDGEPGIHVERLRAGPDSRRGHDRDDNVSPSRRTWIRCHIILS